MKSILITGCNRGLGLGLLKAFINSSKKPSHIFATCRSINKSQELKTLADQHKEIHLLEIDLTDFNSYDKIVKQVDEIVPEIGINLLFNNAGYATKSTRLPFVKVQDLMDTYTINTVVPVMLTKSLLPLLQRASNHFESEPLGVNRAAVVNMSSELGSIEMNNSGGLFPYRISKAGLNAATKSMSIDLKDNGILCVSMHPGWVKTDMGGSNAPLQVTDSCEKMVETVLSLKPEDNGSFVKYDGTKLPW